MLWAMQNLSDHVIIFVDYNPAFWGPRRVTAVATAAQVLAGLFLRAITLDTYHTVSTR